MTNSLYGFSVSSTFQKLVQIVDGEYYDGLGNLLNLGNIGLTGPQGATGIAGTSIMWMGSWTQSIYYVSYDAVSYNSSSYICLTNNPQNHPGVNPLEWNLLSQGIKGETGSQGDTGPGFTMINPSTYSIIVSNGSSNSFISYSNFNYNGTNLILGTGTFSNNSTVYISSAATGSINNYALYINSGVSYFGGNTTINSNLTVNSTAFLNTLSTSVIAPSSFNQTLNLYSVPYTTYNTSSGTSSVINISHSIQQTGTSGYSVLKINPIETTVGSGTKLLIDLQTSNVKKFNVDNNGNTYIKGWLGVNQTSNAGYTGADINGTVRIQSTLTLNSDLVDYNGNWNIQSIGSANFKSITLNSNTYETQIIGGIVSINLTDIDGNLLLNTINNTGISGSKTSPPIMDWDGSFYTDTFNYYKLNALDGLQFGKTGTYPDPFYGVVLTGYLLAVGNESSNFDITNNNGAITISSTNSDFSKIAVYDYGNISIDSYTITLGKSGFANVLIDGGVSTTYFNNSNIQVISYAPIGMDIQTDSIEGSYLTLTSVYSSSDKSYIYQRASGGSGGFTSTGGFSIDLYGSANSGLVVNNDGSIAIGGVITDHTTFDGSILAIFADQTAKIQTTNWSINTDGSIVSNNWSISNSGDFSGTANYANYANSTALIQNNFSGGVVNMQDNGYLQIQTPHDITISNGGASFTLSEFGETTIQDGGGGVNFTGTIRGGGNWQMSNGGLFEAGSFFILPSSYSDALPSSIYSYYGLDLSSDEGPTRIYVQQGDINILSGDEVVTTTGNTNITANGNVKIRATGKTILDNISEFVSNSAAISAGLSVGSIYRTGDILKIVH